MRVAVGTWDAERSKPLWESAVWADFHRGGISIASRAKSAKLRQRHCDNRPPETSASTAYKDGTTYYMADGVHRFLAAQSIGKTTIAADVRPGTKKDALWYALGANRDHGYPLTPADKHYAIRLAQTTWPDLSQADIEMYVLRFQHWYPGACAVRCWCVALSLCAAETSNPNGAPDPKCAVSASFTTGCVPSPTVNGASTPSSAAGRLRCRRS